MIKVKMPASCGEFIQGWILGSEKLVSYPVNIYSEITLLKAEAESVEKRKYKKSYEALKKIFELFNYESYFNEYKLIIDSEIPVGKGMASSTADIAGTVYAALKLINESLSEEEVAKICASIEPTDGTIFKNLTLFDHIKGEKIIELGKVPEFDVSVIEFEEKIDTISFRKKDHKKTVQANSKEMKKAFDLFNEGIKTKDLNKICDASYRSAELNQILLYKERLKEIRDIALKNGAYGINIAHSGSVIGVIRDKMRFDEEKFEYELKKKSVKKFKIINCSTTDGGIKNI